MSKKFLAIMLSTMLICSVILSGCTSTEIPSNNFNSTESDHTKEEKNDKNFSNFKPIADEYITEEYSVQNSAKLIDYLNTSVNDNVILSETSLNMALSMLLEGSDSSSEAYSNLVNYLDLSVYENDIEEIRNRNNWLISSYMNNESVTLDLANSIWVDSRYTLNSTFSDTIQSYYNGLTNSVDFSDSNTVTKINQWCADNTNDCIKEIVEESSLDNNQCMILNALYFNGLWADPFSEQDCIEDQFTNADGSVSMVTMMHDYDAGLYYSNDKAEAFMKYYDGNEIAFIGILPRDEEFTLTDLDIDSLLNNGNDNYIVHAIMPRFVVKDKNSLLPAINAIIPESMSATYSNIINEEPAMITDIMQMTYVDVNSKGTEAAAVTEIGMKTTSISTDPIQYVEINLNRPFVFMIYDTVNHEVLFMGRINQL